MVDQLMSLGLSLANGCCLGKQESNHVHVHY